MAMKNVNGLERRVTCKGAWTAEEDRRLAEFIETHGAKKWETVAIKAGLNRCGKSCRLRWLNYLRPNIKRGNISDEEEDLILRLHRLLGNRWSLIAGRLPGRTDNEIKNYWNSHLSKKVQQMKKNTTTSVQHQSTPQKTWEFTEVSDECEKEIENSDSIFDIKEFFDFSSEGTNELEWIKFLEDPLLYAGDSQSNENISS